MRGNKGCGVRDKLPIKVAGKMRIVPTRRSLGSVEGSIVPYPGAKEEIDHSGGDGDDDDNDEVQIIILDVVRQDRVVIRFLL